ncbi:MAG: DNA polymerase III subunit gamma/tau, partial [Sphingobacteriaceae bacterium]|nr:DNA polymerase III subunit gamma/tau [Sphingobacteriaceae bacterium]
AQTVQLLEVSENIKQKYILQSQKSDIGFILTALNLANQCDLNYKASKNQRLQVEITLIKMCHILSVINLANQPLPSLNATEQQDQIKKKTNLAKETPKIIDAEVQSEIKHVEKQANEVAVKDKISIQPTVSAIKIAPLKENKNSALIPSLVDFNLNATSEESKEPDYIYGEEKESFTLENLLFFWNSYAEDMKSKDKISIYTLLNSNQPLLKSATEILISLENKIQEDMLRIEMIPLLNYLRTVLKNYDITIVSNLLKRNEAKMPYTSAEKFEYLVQKNSNILKFKTDFELDVII